MHEDDYRTRIYSQYLRTRPQAQGPLSLAELAPRAPFLRRLVRMHFPENRDSVVLDLGCGHGALLHFAREAGYRTVRGVDRSPVQAAAARRLGINGVQEGDLRDVLAREAACSLDVVVAFDVVEHFTRDELVPFVDNVYRVLKPGGRWIVHAPNGESPFAGAIRYGDLTHELAFTPASLGQLLLSSGFGSVRFYEDTAVVHGTKSALRWVLWKGIRAALRLYTAVETGDAGSSRIFTRNLLAVAVK